MKSKMYLKLFVYLLSFVVVFVACDDDSDDPPIVVNQAPVISGLNDLTLAPGFETHVIDFANFVTDQEGEIVTYEVTNSVDSVITISLSGSVLTITEVGPGSSEIGVTATDGQEGHEVSTTFTVTVEPISGAADYAGNAVVMLDFNGYGTGSLFDNPVDGLLLEGWNYDWDEGPFGSAMLDHNDHLVITNNVDASWIWAEYELDGNQDCTGKKFRFDISYFTAPNLTDAYWEDDLTAVNIHVLFVDETWEASGGYYRFSSLNLEYSPEWQAVEIPLSDFSSLWELPVDPSTVGVIGFEIWGGTSSDPISFRIDNIGIVD
jgi:hypothetical protein